MAYKLLDAAQDRWRMINGAELVRELLDGQTFKDGIKVTDEKPPRTRGSPPDSLLRYGKHPVIRARVSENAFWARVPRLPPLASGPNPAQPGRVRHAVLQALPAQVVWLAPDGRRLRVFSPPPA